MTGPYERKPYLPAPENADVPCGPQDYAAKFPDPVHVECKECREVIVRILQARKPYPPPPLPAKQEPLFAGLRPRLLRA